MRSLTVLACLLAALRAQEPAPRLLLGQVVVEAPSGQKLCDLAFAKYVRNAFPVGEQVFVVEGRTVDAGDLTVLEVGSENLVLRRPAMKAGEQGTVLWQQALAGLGAWAGEAAQRLLTRDRVVLPRREGGLVALRRADGGLAWQQPGAPSELLLADAELVLAAGTADGKPRVAGFALANGAAAFRAEVPGRPLQLAAAPHGVVVVSEGGVTGLDRSGPKLFGLPQRVQSVVAGPAGWFTLAGTRVEALDRNGVPRWAAELDANEWRDTRQLFVTAAGDVLVLCNQRMSDSGLRVELRSGPDGERLWTRDLKGLEVAHSKYWHYAYARIVGDQVYVVSQGSAGAFYEQLDLETGDTRARHQH